MLAIWSLTGFRRQIRACPETRFWVQGSGFLRRDEGVDDETYRKYVKSELRVAVKNPLPQSEWGFRTCSRPPREFLMGFYYNYSLIRAN